MVKKSDTIRSQYMKQHMATEDKESWVEKHYVCPFLEFITKISHFCWLDKYFNTRRL